MEFRQILFPVDFSARSNAAAKRVRAMAELFGAKIVLLHAVEDPLKWYGTLDPVRAAEVVLPAALNEAEASLKKFAQEEFAGMDVLVRCELAEPLALIERTAHAFEADLIMMPTHGRGRFRSALLGSVTAKVLHDLAIPVWTEAHAEDVPAGAHWPVKTVACAIRLSKESVKVLRFAAEFAARTGASLFVTHEVPVGELRLGDYVNVEPPQYMEDFAREEIAKLQKEAGTAADVWIARGGVASHVREAALERKADLVIIGRGRIGHFGGGLAPHAYAIIREAPCPVLSL